LTIAVAIAIFGIAWVLPKVLVSSVFPSRLTTQALTLVLSLLAIVLLGKRRFAEYGFKRPNRHDSSKAKKIRWMPISLTAALLGVAASLTMIGLDGTGNPMARQLTLPQILLFVIILAPVTEELFMRGFVQSHLSSLSGKYVGLHTFRVELPVLISATCFACFHLHLPFLGADAVTAVTIFFFTFSIGLLAGHLRARTGSLVPAIVAHSLANVAGMVTGILYRVISS
jgi:membrane protease YdiL (CAAX protease family)